MREIFRKSGFFVLGIFSLLYVVFTRHFAEMYARISFLNFPIFAGEILLFICLILSFFIFDFRFIKGWKWCVVFYFLFVILKALWGYSLWGPLALRHAALFYYPVFIFFGFIFYKRAFLSESLKLFIAFLILALCLTKYFCWYWLLTLWITAFIFTRSFRRRATRYFFYAALLSVIILSYKALIMTSRTFIVGNVTAAVFLIITLSLVAKIRVFYKVVIVGAIFLLLGTFVFKYSTLNATGTIFDINGTISRFKGFETRMKTLRSNYVRQNLKNIELFNIEQPLAYKAPGEIFNTKPEIKWHEMLEAEMRTSKPYHISRDLKGEKRLEQAPSITSAAVEKPQIEVPEKMVAPVEEKIKGKKAVVFAAPVEEKIKGKKAVVFAATVEKSQITDNALSNEPITKTREVEGAYTNTLFRLFIWRDMISEFSQYRPILGFSFGKPFRSESLEILDWASSEWMRDGWIEPHNSYLNMLYRAGILGVALIGFLIWQFFRMVKGFIALKSSPGILLCSILITWLTAANFLPILELPYSAIPIWVLWGVTLGYLKELKTKSK